MTRVLLTLAAAIFLAFAAVACGGGDDDTTATATQASTATNNGNGNDDTATPDGDEETNTPEATADEGDDDNGVGGVVACNLLSEETVGAAAGQEVEISNGVDDNCTFETTDEFSVYSADLKIRHGSHDEVKEYFDIDVGDSVPVDGLGDEAKWTEGFGLLEVLQGEFTFGIQIIDYSSASNGPELDQAKAMAAEVVENLP